jgi:hypothetical protein
MCFNSVQEIDIGWLDFTRDQALGDFARCVCKNYPPANRLVSPKNAAAAAVLLAASCCNDSPRA